MATKQVNPVVDHLRRAVLAADGAGLTDRQLLGHFVEHRDEAAFESILRRHGPMVLGVCRRVLSSPQDAEDAFPATFLVLVRKAASIARRELLAGWLYGVARTTALRAKVASAKLRARERQVADMPEPEAVQQEDLWRDLQPLLHQELGRLPDKYRVPVVLCDLEGKTQKEAAKQLGLPEGTVSSRLSRARAMLARRLARYGLLVSAVSLTAALAHEARASVPTSLLTGTVRAAGAFAAGNAAAAGVISTKVATLTKGVLRTMLLTKLASCKVGPLPPSASKLVH
jgi:RNA polymerase sigma factor (sigma-70 family)